MFEFLKDSVIMDSVKPLIAFLAAAVYRQFRKRYELKQAEDRARFEFIQSFLEGDVRQKHHLVVEEAFLNYLGRQLGYDEIIFLLSQRNPSSAFHAFIKARNYIHFDEAKGAVVFRGRYKDAKRRKALEYWHVSLYFASATAGVCLLLFSYMLINTLGLTAVPVLVTTVLSLLAAAYLQVSDSAGLYFAEKLIRQVDGTNAKRDKEPAGRGGVKRRA